MAALLLLPGEIKYEANNTINPLLKKYIEEAKLIIAVDGGIIHAEALDLTPDYWVGDFDSIKEFNNYPQLFLKYEKIEKHQFSCDKDLLDTEIALNLAIDKGVNTCVLFGGIGGRIDHSLALHLMPLQYPHIRFIHTNGIDFLQTILSDENKKQISNTHSKLWDISANLNQTFSLIPLENCLKVSLSGAKWDLNHFDFETGTGRGLSNIAVNTQIKITYQKGCLWFVTRY